MPSKANKPNQQQTGRPAAAPESGWLRKYWQPAVIITMIIVVAASMWWLSPDAPATSAAQPTASPSPKLLAQSNRSASAILPATPMTERAQQLKTLASQVELADHTLCSYRVGTKYPLESRPISEHPDQIYPNRPVEDSHPLRKENNQTDASVQIKTSQSRIYVGSGESVALTLKAVDKDGATLPLFVTRAVAHGIAPNGKPAPDVTLPFGDDGKNGDVAAGDLTSSTLFAPAATSLANFNGTIHIEVKYNVGDKAGTVLFDIIYTPEIPATWAGPIRDGVENGSLVYFMKIDVRQAGRYIVSGRVDDAKGKPFALASFNDLLKTGPNEIKLIVFGKLLRDQNPTLPLTLRDVDGYLLKENVDPDRALIPRIIGTAHVSKTYAPTSFSDAEAQSEERTRYLTEFSKDVALAKEALVKFNPDQANQPFPQSECSKTGGAGGVGLMKPPGG